MRKLLFKTYIYLKKHNPTGTYYLGVTNHYKPFTYKGGGTKWKRLLREYGSDITTFILLETNDEAELKRNCEYYSNLWNIVDNPNFANRMRETGNNLPEQFYY